MLKILILYKNPDGIQGYRIISNNLLIGNIKKRNPN